MRILFIDHAFHQKTKSSEFFYKLLLERGKLDFFWDSKTWCGDGISDFPQSLLDQYDLIVFFQSEGVLSKVLSFGALNLPKITFIPMYDSARSLPPDFWKLLPKQARILNFSRTLHQRVEELGCNSGYFKFFLDPSKSAVCSYKQLSGTFWWRSKLPNFKVIRKLTNNGNGFHKFHVHIDRDSGFAINMFDRIFLKCPLETTFWGKDSREYSERLSHSNVYFAPRTSEGIGMSFLEAMARGQAVAAVNAPTMNEYIEHGVNGWLYDAHDPAPIDFSCYRSIGENARATVQSGYENWIKETSSMLDWACHC